MGGEIVISPIVIWVTGLTAILSFATTIWNLMTSGARANSKLIAEHGKLLAQISNRLDRLEGHYEHLPDTDTMHRLELSMTRLEGELVTVNERLKPVASIVDRMQDYLLAQSQAKR